MPWQRAYPNQDIRRFKTSLRPGFSLFTCSYGLTYSLDLTLL